MSEQNYLLGGILISFADDLKKSLAGVGTSQQIATQLPEIHKHQKGVP